LPALIGALDGIEQDTSAIEARIKSVADPKSNLKAWDTIIAIKTSDKDGWSDIDSWSKVHDLLMSKQARGEIAVKVRRGNDVISAKVVAK
jgi:hypothetical protein